MPPWLPSRLPIIQAPMAGSQGVELCVAVCEAGGLGSIPSAMLTPAILSDQIGEVRARTRGPFNVNFFCHAPPAADPERQARWLESLARAYAEAGLEPSAAGGGPGRAPFDAAMAEVVEALKPPVVSFHFGLPEEALLAAGQGRRGKSLFLRDDGRRGSLARGARRRRGDRARRGSRRSSRHVLERRRRRPAGPVRASAAGRRRGSASGHRRRRHRRRPGRRGRLRARRQRRADRHRVPEDAASGHAASPSSGAERSARRCDQHHQPLHRPPGARNSQPLHARAWADERRRPRLPACNRRGRSAARPLGEARLGRLFAAVGGPSGGAWRARRTPARSPSGYGARRKRGSRRCGSTPSSRPSAS